MVGLFAELQMLAGADVFVGTFSSNIGRLVFLMRESLGFARDSSLGADRAAGWFAGRRNLRELER